jgi:hypothetical protein
VLVVVTSPKVGLYPNPGIGYSPSFRGRAPFYGFCPIVEGDVGSLSPWLHSIDDSSKPATCSRLGDPYVGAGVPKGELNTPPRRVVSAVEVLARCVHEAVSLDLVSRAREDVYVQLCEGMWFVL